MNKEDIFEIVRNNLIEILPELDRDTITPLQSMKDLGANSIDRVDVIVNTMEVLGLMFPPHEIGLQKNMQGLVDFLYDKYLAL